MTAWVLSSSVLILTVTALRYFLRGKISLRMQYALWLLVLARLLVPVSFGASSLSVMNAVPVRTQTIKFDTELPNGGAGTDPVPAAAPVRSPVTPASPGTGQSRQSGSAASTEVPANTRTAVSWERLAKAVWLTGVAVVGTVFLAANLHFYGKLRRSRRKVDAQAALPVYESSAILTPCLFGLVRPAIYVTPEVLADHEALGYALVHEETHRRHGDDLWALLRGVCLALHWFNPLVWWAAELSRRDAELACDEAAIQRLGEGARAAYGRTLLRLTCEKCAVPFMTAIMMTDSDKGLRERITLLVKRPRTTACAALAMLTVILFAAACTFTGGKGGGAEKPESTPAAAGINSSKDAADAPLADFKLYVPWNSMEPDMVPVDTMGDTLVDETLPDGTRIVCYWEPGSEYTKYWAVRREDTLLRFCVEESAYGGDYGVEPFSNVLGQSGFRILAPRGAGYYAYDYYVLDSEGVPRLLADCANEVEEADFNGDGETDLRWYYHGDTETYTYFRYGGKLYLAHSVSRLAHGFSTDPLPAIPAGDAVEDAGSPQLQPVSSIWGTTLPDEAFAAEREEFLNAELDQDAIRQNVSETSNLRLLQTLPEQGISLYGYSSENWRGYGLVFYVSGTQKLYRVPIIYADNHDITPELYMGPDDRLYLIVHAGSGTGVSISELYVFRPDQDMEMGRIDYVQLTDALSRAIRVRYDSRTDRARVYDLHGTLLAEAGIGAIGIQPDEVFAPDSYYCGAYLHYMVSENGGIRGSFDVRLCADGSVGDGTLHDNPMLTAEVLLQFDESGSLSGFIVENISVGS